VGVRAEGRGARSTSTSIPTRSGCWYAVELYGSQQKGLIAALQALQDAEFLRSEIERLKAENERQRELLAEAESLFNR
jgi:hypothetical protein